MGGLGEDGGFVEESMCCLFRLGTERRAAAESNAESDASRVQQRRGHLLGKIICIRGGAAGGDRTFNRLL